MKIVIYLINLDGSFDRLASATQQLERDGVEFLRVPAFDGRGRNVNDFKDYDQQGAISYMGRPLRGGEIGCYYSHVDCAKRFLASGADYAIVLEDDVFIYPGAVQKLQKLIATLESRHPHWDVMNFGAQKNKIYSKIFHQDGVDVIGAYYFPMTTTGIAWTKDGAQRFLNECQRIYAPIDNMLREWQSNYGNGLSVIPPLVSTTGAESDIDHAGVPLRSKGERSVAYGVKKQWRLLRNKMSAFKLKILAKR